MSEFMRNFWRIAVFFLLILAPAKGFTQKPVPGLFEVTGMGGAGGMYTPASSPVNPDFMLVSCDMSGSYRSLNGGGFWEMINSMQLSSSMKCRPMFVGEKVYWILDGQLRASSDSGKTWRPVPEGAAPWGSEGVSRLSHLPGTPPILIVGAGNNVHVSADGGKTWNAGAKGTGGVNGLAVAGITLFSAIGTQIWKSSDSGKTWNTMEIAQANGKPVVALAAGAENGSQIVFAVVDDEGVLRSNDLGETWIKVLGKDSMTSDGTRVVSELSDIVMPGNQVNAAYVNSVNQVFKTENGGTTWVSVFRMDSNSNPGKSSLPFNVEKSWVQTEVKWGYDISPAGVGVNPSNPNIAMVTTQGDFYKTTDGGNSWKQIMNEKVGVKPGDPGNRFRSIGLEVTSSWQFLFDPFDTSRYYIAYTDIGFARSVDQGKTWIHSVSGSGSWGNTYYHIAFDPEIKGRMYAAASSRHDIPHWSHTSSNTSYHQGGVVMSSNHGISWTQKSNGLPLVPCTWVELDPKSPKEKRTLYAAMYEQGIYKSVDNGDTWEKKSNGLGNPGNMHVLQVQIQPGTGNLFASITAHRHDNSFPVAGGLWKSIDGGENWTDLTATLGLKWATHFALHPDNPDIIYLSAATAAGAPQGGVYKTTDGGKNWERLLSDADFAKRCPPSYVHSMQVQLHPKNPDYVYLATTHGLWVSTNGGKEWEWFDNFPFRRVQNVTFDPRNPELMIVNTFGGGVWRGFCLPSGSADLSAVIFESGFEEGNKAIWDDYDNNPDTENQLLADPGPFGTQGNHVLRLAVALGESGGSDMIKILPSQHDSLYVRWYIKYEPGFNFNARNHGGGLFAGARNFLGQSDSRPDGDDFAISTLEYNRTLHTPQIYSYYRGMYQDCSNPEGSCCGDVFPCTSDEGKTYCTDPAHRDPPLPPVLRDNKWYCMEMKWKLGTPSTDGSVRDGEISLWVDGMNYGSWKDLWIRTTGSLKAGILWLSLYHHDGTHSDAGILLDNVTVSTQRIGCSVISPSREPRAAKDHIKIYPNPSSSKVRVELDKFTDFSLRLYDITGKMVLSESFSGDKGSLGMEDQKPGIYILTVTGEKEELLASPFKVVRN